MSFSANKGKFRTGNLSGVVWETSWSVRMGKNPWGELILSQAQHLVTSLTISPGCHSNENRVFSCCGIQLELGVHNFLLSHSSSGDRPRARLVSNGPGLGQPKYLHGNLGSEHLRPVTKEYGILRIVLGSMHLIFPLPVGFLGKDFLSPNLRYNVGRTVQGPRQWTTP